jgi:predicted RNA-binding protein with RPS1 domain
LSNEYVSDPADIVSLGHEIEVTVLDVDRKKRQIRLSAKVAEEVLEEEEPEEELPTAMELALRAAMEDKPTENVRPSSSTPVRQIEKKSREVHEELLQRTLEERMKTSSTGE